LLIVEDNPEMRAYIRRCLGEDRYRITEAADGQQGIEKAQGLIPDLIISDVMMPKQDGFAVTRAIRRNVRTSHIPLVLLTAKTTLESRLTGLQRGADAYLTKPFSPRELVLRTEKLIEIRRLLQQRYQSGSPPAEADTYGQEDAFISTLHNYVLAHIDETDLSGDRIGQHFGMSRIHLYRKLKALTDQSITEFVKAVRLQKAYELLQQGQGNVSEVAYQTGFSSLSHFSRSFKQAYGITPSQV
jgi:DNA-binding response OmpR family regulator